MFFATALKPSGGPFVRIGILVWFAFGFFLRPAFSQAPQTQSSKQEPTIVELQKQMEEMRSQMVTMQGRIEELEATRGITATNSGADPVTLHSENSPAQALPLKQPDEAKNLHQSTIEDFL